MIAFLTILIVAGLVAAWKLGQNHERIRFRSWHEKGRGHLRLWLEGQHNEIPSDRELM